MSPHVMLGSGAMHAYILHVYFHIWYLLLHLLYIFIVCIGITKLYNKQIFFMYLVFK